MGFPSRAFAELADRRWLDLEVVGMGPGSRVVSSVRKIVGQDMRGDLSSAVRTVTRR